MFYKSRMMSRSVKHGGYNDKTKGKEYLEKALSFGFPKDPYDLNAYGEALYWLGRYEEAVKIF